MVSNNDDVEKMKEMLSKQGGCYRPSEVKFEQLITKYGGIAGALRHGEDEFLALLKYLEGKDPLPREKHLEDLACFQSYIANKFFPDEAIIGMLTTPHYVNAISIHMWYHGYRCALKDNNLI